MGTRNRLASSTTSATVRAASHGWISASTSARRGHRPSCRHNSGSSTSSGCSTMVAKSRHCWPVTIDMPTQPSLAGSMDGISTERANSVRPIRDAWSHSWPCIDWVMHSSSEISMWKSRGHAAPVRSPRRAARMANAAYMPPTYSPIRPPTDTGGPSGKPRKPVAPQRACRVNSVAGRSSHGPLQPKSLTDTTSTPG